MKVKRKFSHGLNTIWRKDFGDVNCSLIIFKLFNSNLALKRLKISNFRVHELTVPLIILFKF